MPPIGSPRIYYPVPLFFGELPGTGIGTALIRIQKLSCIPALQPSQREPDSLVPRLSSLVFRPSSFVPRLSSLVLRLSSPGGRIQWGEPPRRFPPWPGGRSREPFGRFPGAFSFPSFFLSHKKKDGRRRQTQGVYRQQGKAPVSGCPNDLSTPSGAPRQLPQGGSLIPIPILHAPQANSFREAEIHRPQGRNSFFSPSERY